MLDVTGEAGVVGVILWLGVKAILDTKGLGIGKPKWAEELSRKLDSHSKEEALYSQKVIELYEWHKPDSSGEQSWKNARLNKVIEDNTAAIQQLTAVVSQLGARNV